MYILTSRYDLVAGRSNVIPYLHTCQKNLLQALTTVTMLAWRIHVHFEIPVGSM